MEGAARSFPWRQRLQQLANQLRVSCGIECRDMQQHFNGLSGVRSEKSQAALFEAGSNADSIGKQTLLISETRAKTAEALVLLPGLPLLLLCVLAASTADSVRILETDAVAP